MSANKGAFSRAGKVLAPDSKWTGEEPDWNGWEKWGVEKFMRERSRMINFYGYYLTSADTLPSVLNFMKNHGYSKNAIQSIKSANPNNIPGIIGKLCRAMERGMPALHPDAVNYYATLPFAPEGTVPKPDDEIVKNEINKVLTFIASKTTNSEQQQNTNEQVEVKPQLTVQDKLRIKVDREVIYHLDEMIDSWGSDLKVQSFNILNLISSAKIPSNACEPIVKWITRHLEELQGAYDKSDPDFVEGYSFLSRPAIRNRIVLLEQLKNDVEGHSKTKKQQRKPRAKKTKDAVKQVSKLKYQVSSKEYSIDSISPLRIPGAQRVYFFNTKTRSLSVYHAKGAPGFEVKGSSLKDFDEGTSFVTSTIRKPKEVLVAVNTLPPKQLDKFIDGLNVKKRKANGRINEQTIILKTIETKIK